MSKLDADGVSMSIRYDGKEVHIAPSMKDATEFYVDKGPDDVIIEANDDTTHSTITLEKQAATRLAKELIDSINQMECSEGE